MSCGDGALFPVEIFRIESEQRDCRFAIVDLRDSKESAAVSVFHAPLHSRVGSVKLGSTGGGVGVGDVGFGLGSISSPARGATGEYTRVLSHTFGPGSALQSLTPT